LEQLQGGAGLPKGSRRLLARRQGVGNSV